MWRTQWDERPPFFFLFFLDNEGLMKREADFVYWIKRFIQGNTTSSLYLYNICSIALHKDTIKSLDIFQNVIQMEHFRDFTVSHMLQIKHTKIQQQENIFFFLFPFLVNGVVQQHCWVNTGHKVGKTLQNNHSKPHRALKSCTNSTIY